MNPTRIVLCIVCLGSLCTWADPLPNTQPLTMKGDLAQQMVEGLHTYLDKRIIEQRDIRQQTWRKLYASSEHETLLKEKRNLLATIIGAVDERVAVTMNTMAPPGQEGPIATGDNYTIYSVRWPVFPGVHGEGLLVEPKGDAVASVVLLPDCDQNPETLVDIDSSTQDLRPYALQMASSGYRIIIPTLINRDNTWSGTPGVRMTSQPHREFIYRGAYEMGRHIIGYEVQKVLSAIDWLEEQSADSPIGVYGYGEGGLLALYTGALDTRVDSTMVSGYFGPKDNLWEAPIYRNVWALLNDFGDAELATMIAPRKFGIDPATPPAITGPPITKGRSGAAPGKIDAPSKENIWDELTKTIFIRNMPPDTRWAGQSGVPTSAPFKKASVRHFHLSLDTSSELSTSVKPPNITGPLPDPQERMKRQFHELLNWTKHIMEEGPFMRAKLWEKVDAKSVDTWVNSTKEYRSFFHEEVIGKLPKPTMPFHPRTRMTHKTDNYTGYEVVLDVYEDVFAYGTFLVPNDIKPGEKRPVVVCQHGLEGRPQEITDPTINSPYYEQYGHKLAEEGFIVYAPQNPYIGKDHFRTVQRKANPLKLSLFSFIIEQHRQTLAWLSSLPYVDPERIAFYGLSYGGKTAMRVPAILEQYCLSICSGDFNEWIWKNVSTRRIYSYMFHGEYEMFEWNMGNTLNYAEMSWLICPRPFMVERGHGDGVAPDEWVAYEYAKVQRRYDLLGIGDEATIEHFNGPHKIHGVGTFEFLHEKLNFP